MMTIYLNVKLNEATGSELRQELKRAAVDLKLPLRELVEGILDTWVREHTANGNKADA